MIRATSLLAYAEVLQTLGERQLQVLRCLSKFDSATNLMLARSLGWDINRVVPRIYELRKRLLVIEDKTDECKITGRKAIYWKFDKK